MPAGELKRIHCWVSGRVQGVWYRASAQAAARNLGLSGWVRNLPDRRVEVVAQGPAGAIDEFLEWIRAGPPKAQVEDVAVEIEEPASANGGFEVIY